MIKRFITVTLFICLVFGTAFAQETYREHIASATEHMKELNYEAAVASYEAAKRVGGRSWTNRNETELNAAKDRRMDQLRNQADGLFQAAKYNEAIEMYTTAMKYSTPGNIYVLKCYYSYNNAYITNKIQIEEYILE